MKGFDRGWKIGKVRRTRFRGGPSLIAIFCAVRCGQCEVVFVDCNLTNYEGHTFDWCTVFPAVWRLRLLPTRPARREEHTAWNIFDKAQDFCLRRLEHGIMTSEALMAEIIQAPRIESHGSRLTEGSLMTCHLAPNTDNGQEMSPS